MGILSSLTNSRLATQAHSASMAAEAAHRRHQLERQGFEVIGAKIDKRTGKHTIIYRGETRVPSTPPRDGVE